MGTDGRYLHKLDNVDDTTATLVLMSTSVSSGLEWPVSIRVSRDHPSTSVTQPRQNYNRYL